MSIQVLRQLTERGQVATVAEVRAAIEEYDRLQKLVDDWRICADARTVRCDELRAALEMVEWVEEDGWPVCAWCKSFQEDGAHEPTCARQSALQPNEERKTT